MLPSRKFSRVTRASIFLLVLLLLLDLLFLRHSPSSVLVSNLLNLAAILFATACSFFAARRASGYPRQLWLLLTVALSLVCIAQAIATYYQTFVPSAAQSPWPSDVLFFIWAAPVFMMFLPRSEEGSYAIDSLRLLDFLQVAIVAVTIYAYYFYAPMRWQTGQPGILREMLFLFIARDAALSGAFFFRSRATLPAWLRVFSLTMAFVFLLSCLSAAEFLITLDFVANTVTWGDLLSLLPFLLISYFASAWEPPQPEALKPVSPATAMVGSQILPVVIPLLVIFMSRAIARDQFVFAWVAVTASVLCSSVRLILTNRRQRRVAEHLLATERALRSSEEILSTAFRNSPDAFSINPFPNGPYIEVNDGYTRLTGYSREEVLGKTPRQMNLWVDFDSRDRILATLRESGDVRDFEFRFRNKAGQILIGQMSASLLDIRGQRCSLVIVRDITARKEAEDILRSSEERFRSLVRDLYFAVVLHTPEGLVEFANGAAHRMFQIPEGASVGKRLTELGIFAVAEDGSPLPFEDHPVPYVLRTRVAIRDGLMAFRRSGSDQVFWLFGSSVPEFDAHGNILRVISSFADVTEMKNAERAIHNLSSQLLNLQDAERRRLGRELHDGLAQTVLAINLSLAQARQSLTDSSHPAARCIERARALTQQMSREIRTLSYLLHPPLLDDLGLVSTLKEYAHGFSERSGIRTDFFADTLFERLPQPLEIALFRVVQESLTNIQRHSGSTSAEIRLVQRDSLLTLEVVDHGHGFHVVPSRTNHTSVIPTGVREPGDRSSIARPPSTELPATASNSAPRLGVGIPGMRERISQLGGSLEILSSPLGTTIRATISLNPTPTETHDALASHPDRR